MSNKNFYKMENSTKFSKTQGLIDFLISQGANTCKMVRNPHTGTRFFAVEGTDLTGHVSSKVGPELSADLCVSWIEGVNPKGEPFAMYSLHRQGSSENTLDTFSVQ